MAPDRPPLLARAKIVPQTVICMRWGDRYGPDYVERLYSMVRRHTSRELRFVCFTDRPERFAPPIEALPLPEITLPDKLRWTPWRKMSLWQAPLSDLQGDALFLDLDVVVTGSLDSLFDFAPGCSFCVAHNWSQPKKRIGNTSVFRFRIGSHAHLYEKLMNDPDSVFGRYRIEQLYISSEIEEMRFWPRGWCLSFKHSLLPPWPLNLVMAPKLPAEARVVAFTGKPDPDEAIAGRWPAPWYQKPYKYVRPVAWIGQHWQ
jgi:hypothetical protein